MIHGRDTKSRQWPKITVHGKNYGNHGDREFVILILTALLISH